MNGSAANGPNRPLWARIAPLIGAVVLTWGTAYFALRDDSIRTGERLVSLEQTITSHSSELSTLRAKLGDLRADSLGLRKDVERIEGHLLEHGQRFLDMCGETRKLLAEHEKNARAIELQVQQNTDALHLCTKMLGIRR